MKRLLPILFLFILFTSCRFNDSSDSKNVVDCPSDIAERAFRFSELYKDSDTIYEWGGQSPVRSAIAIDCSGLVVMCYKYAIVDTKYSLLAQDLAVKDFYKKSSSIVPLEKLRRGDLIFMGSETNPLDISHIALFDCIENDNIYFIDSTDLTNTVSRRYYSKNNPKFKAFGVMKLKYVN